MRKFSQKFKTGASVAAVVVVLLGIYSYRKLQALAADPTGEKDCGPAVGGGEQAKIDLERIKAIAPLKDVKWSQLGGSINDASCLNKTEIYGVVEVRSVEDIAKTLAFARDNKLSVTTAGVRHSMGGQAFRKGGIVLDMRGFNKIVLNESSRSVTVQPGATWHDIQNVLHPRFAVRAMQSTDIFSVGGSISVNAHGMDHQAGALAKSIKSMKVMLADGSLQTVSATENKDLFNLVVGGYGLFGVIVEAELDIADNLVYQTGRRVMDYKEFPALFAGEIEKDGNIGLMYGHLSTAPSSFLKELLLYTYTKVDGTDFKREPLGEVSGTKLRRLTINLSKQGAAVPGNEVAVGKAHRAPDGDLHGDAGAGDRIGGGLPRQPQRPDARFRALFAQLAAQRHRHPARIFHPAQPVRLVRRRHAQGADRQQDQSAECVGARRASGKQFPDLFAGAGVLAGALHQPDHG